MIGPAPILAVIVGLFHVSAYVFIRGRAGARLPLLLIAAVLGAWAGDTVGARMAIDPIRIGEFHLLTASIVAWLAIGLVAIVSVLVPERRARVAELQVETTLTHARPAIAVGPGTDASGGEAEPEIPATVAEPEPEPELQPTR